jgi:hypothetical protein
MSYDSWKTINEDIDKVQKFSDAYEKWLEDNEERLMQEFLDEVVAREEQ